MPASVPLEHFNHQTLGTWNSKFFQCVDYILSGATFDCTSVPVDMNRLHFYFLRSRPLYFCFIAYVEPQIINIVVDIGLVLHPEMVKDDILFNEDSR